MWTFAGQNAPPTPLFTLMARQWSESPASRFWAWPYLRNCSWAVTPIQWSEKLNSVFLYLRKLKLVNLPQKLLVNIYHCTTVSVPTYCVSVVHQLYKGTAASTPRGDKICWENHQGPFTRYHHSLTSCCNSEVFPPLKKPQSCLWSGHVQCTNITFGCANKLHLKELQCVEHFLLFIVGFVGPAPALHRLWMCSRTLLFSKSFFSSGDQATTIQFNNFNEHNFDD